MQLGSLSGQMTPSSFVPVATIGAYSEIPKLGGAILIANQPPRAIEAAA
jgi:hypothetical protein